MEIFGNWDEKEIKPRIHAAATIHILPSINQDSSPEDCKIVLHKVILMLEKAFAGEINEIPWILMAGTDYIYWLRAGNSVALAILMHHGVLLVRVVGIWWTRYAGTKIVQELLKRLEGFNADYVSMVRWCRGHARI